MLSYHPLHSCALASFTVMKILRMAHCNIGEKAQTDDFSSLTVSQFSVVLQIYFRSAVVQWCFFTIAWLTAELNSFWDCMAQKVMGVLCLAKSEIVNVSEDEGNNCSWYAFLVHVFRQDPSIHSINAFKIGSH